MKEIYRVNDRKYEKWKRIGIFGVLQKQSREETLTSRGRIRTLNIIKKETTLQN